MSVQARMHLRINDWVNVSDSRSSMDREENEAAATLDTS